jgi:hypothetical protein
LRKINRLIGIRFAARTMAGAHNSEAVAPKKILRRVSLRSKPELGGIAFIQWEKTSRLILPNQPVWAGFCERLFTGRSTLTSD